MKQETDMESLGMRLTISDRVFENPSQEKDSWVKTWRTQEREWNGYLWYKTSNTEIS